MPRTAGATAFVRRQLVRCLAKNPKQRLRDIGDLSGAISGLLGASLAQLTEHQGRLVAVGSFLTAGGVSSDSVIARGASRAARALRSLG